MTGTLLCPDSCDLVTICDSCAGRKLWERRRRGMVVNLAQHAAGNWSRVSESNRRPSLYEGDALAAAPTRRTG